MKFLNYLFLSLLSFLKLPHLIYSQPWSDLSDITYSSDESDPSKPFNTGENDPLRVTSWPSEMPSISLQPSQFPSFIPSQSPSQFPSNEPSQNPSHQPTISSQPTISNNPSQASLNPSSFPTSSPTQIPTIAPTPEDRPDNYFNYNPTSRYGPPNWDDLRDGEEFFDRYVEADKRDCGDDHNSPINLEWKDQCEDDHQIHTEKGSNDWDTNRFEVLPHALRAIFKQSKKPPRADFSNLSKFVNAYYLDVKLPSEHVMEGKQYLGEVHIGHDWESRGINIGFFLDPVMNVHNPRLEFFIREWEEFAWERQHACQHRSEVNIPRYQRKYPVRNKEEMKRVWLVHDRSGNADWDVYQLQPTVWYYGYRGSFTVPPCSETVYWRFLDFPAHISWKQYNRMKALITNQLDDNCQRSSIAHNGGINRPVQRFRGDVWRCKGWKVKYEEDWENMWPESYHAMKSGKLD